MDQGTLARFKSKFFVLPSECWYWTANVNDDGYGMFFFEGQNRPAHRVSYLLFVGSIPDGLVVDHLCHTWDWSCPGGMGDHHRRCVNWRHLQPVPPPENTRRGRRGGEQEYCPNGHLYTSETTYYPPKGGRECRICRHEQSVAWMAVHNPGVRHGTETHCPAGHEYAGDNLIITSSGGRACRECKRDSDRRQMRARRALERGYRPLLLDSTTCPVGHDLAGDNSAIYQGQLVCLICMTPDGSRSKKGAEALIAAANSALTLSGMLF